MVLQTSYVALQAHPTARFAPGLTGRSAHAALLSSPGPSASCDNSWGYFENLEGSKKPPDQPTEWD